MSSWIGFHQDISSGILVDSYHLFYFFVLCPWNPWTIPASKVFLSTIFRVQVLHLRARHRSNPAWGPNHCPKLRKKKTVPCGMKHQASPSFSLLGSWSHCAPSFSYCEITSSRWSGWTSATCARGSSGFVTATHGQGIQDDPSTLQWCAGRQSLHLGYLRILWRSQAVSRFWAGAVQC